MIEAKTFAFLKQLKLNNNKPWFDENRPAYELAKENFIQFTKAILDGLAAFDSNIALANLEPKKCISRINRDVRFSKNKEPYKTNFLR